MRVVAWLLCGLTLVGCSSAIRLQHPDGREAKCGPFHAGLGMQFQIAEREARCIDDFRRQGFERKP